MVAALYLSVTARSALLGREIQRVEWETEDMRYKNADLETELAEMLSLNEMRQRALAAGFQETKPEDVEYIYVPGYVPPAPVILERGDETLSSIQETNPEYTESLFDWLRRVFEGAASEPARMP